MSNLLNDFWNFFGLEEVISEGKKEDGPLVLRGLISEADVLNKNNRIYPKKILEAEIKRLSKIISEEGYLTGELDHPNTPTINLKNAANKLTKVWMEGNKVYGEFAVMDTHAGRIVKDLIKEGIKVGVSSRATGNLIPLQEGKYQVGDNLRIKCWDFVADPSFSSAIPEMVQESTLIIEKGLEAAKKEEAFIAALKFAIKNRK
jgi:hypothetical protein